MSQAGYRAMRRTSAVTLIAMAGCGMNAAEFKELAGETIGVEAEYIEVVAAPSRIRPDLSYAVASATVDDVEGTRRVVAVRDRDRYRPLETFSDWESAILAGWGRPEPISACVEAATVTIWLEEWWGAFVAGDGRELDSRNDLTGPGWERVAHPRLLDVDEPLVELWVVRAGESARYRCGFRNQSVYLEDVELLVGTGLIAIDL